MCVDMLSCVPDGPLCNLWPCLPASTCQHSAYLVKRIWTSGVYLLNSWALQTIHSVIRVPNDTRLVAASTSTSMASSAAGQQSAGAAWQVRSRAAGKLCMNTHQVENS